MKLFSPDPRIGFLAHADAVQAALAAGTLPPGVKDAAGAARLLFNDRLDAAVAGIFLLAVLIILIDSAREWFHVLGGRKPMQTTEFPAIPRGTVTAEMRVELNAPPF